MSATFVTNYGDVIAPSSPHFDLIDNYVYLYHTDTLIILPTFPESIADTMPTSYTPTTIIGRSAPIYSFTNSGPRSVQIDLKLHRDMLNQVNLEKNAATYSLKFFDDADSGDLIRKKLQRKDYVDLMINELQSIALPSYLHGEKMVDPPLVAIRFGDEIFCKGIVDGGVSVNFNGPILANPLCNDDGEYLLDDKGKIITGKGKYALVDISFKVTEVDPYDAGTVAQFGSMRGLNRTLEKNIYKVPI